MGIIKETIIVENRLVEMFDCLPNINGFKPTFGCGDNKELLTFLKLKTSNDPYPLIWLQYPYIEYHERTRVNLKDVNFILAAETNKVMLNEQRIEDVYKPILFKLLDNIKDLFKRANIVNWNDSIKVIKFPNYSGLETDDKENHSIARWDSLKITLDMSMNDVCFRKVKF